MPDLISRRIGVRGEKRHMEPFLQAMAKRASQRAADSYLYEQILRPNEIMADNEDYGLTKGFDGLPEETITQFVSSGGTIRAFASEIPFEEMFQEIVTQHPNLEFYAEVLNIGGIRETSPYVEVFYSPMGQQTIQAEEIQIMRDFYAEEFMDELEDLEFDEEEDDGEPYLSKEQIDEQYLACFGKPHKYFNKLLDENKTISSSEPALQKIVDSILEQAGFTFDGANFDEGEPFTAEKRLQSFFDNKPVYHEPDVLAYLELILCDGDCINQSVRCFDWVNRVTYEHNPDGSVLFASYERQEPESFQEKAEHLLALFCKSYENSRVYGCYGTPTERQYFYSEQGEALCRTADTPKALQHGGGTPLELPTTMGDIQTQDSSFFIFVDFRGSIEEYAR